MIRRTLIAVIAATVISTVGASAMPADMNMIKAATAASEPLQDARWGGWHRCCFAFRGHFAFHRHFFFRRHFAFHRPFFFRRHRAFLRDRVVIRVHI